MNTPLITVPQPLDIELRTIKNALGMLMGCGCTFAVVTRDGIKHGTLELAAPDPVKPRGERHPGVSYYIDKELKKIDAAKGGSVAILPNEKYSVKVLANCASARCFVYFGANKFRTQRFDDRVEVNIYGTYNGVGVPA